MKLYAALLPLLVHPESPLLLLLLMLSVTSTHLIVLLICNQLQQHQQTETWLITIIMTMLAPASGGCQPDLSLKIQEGLMS